MMEIVQKENALPEQLNELETAVLKALVYFDIFRYPLTITEIVRFSPTFFPSLEAVQQVVTRLESDFIIFRFGEYYSIHNDIALVNRRKMGNSRALGAWTKARKVSNFIHQFPFVRSVNISGSLSKNYVDDSTDFDFFIITEPNRIWLTRTMLALYKKIFLLNNRKYFCINYFISSDELDIPDQNLFSATEILTLHNMTGPLIYAQFIASNAWAASYFPNAEPDLNEVADLADTRLKRWLEGILSGRIGDWLDNLGLRITYAFWRRKFSYMQEAEFAVNMRSKKQVSKHHPQGFQFKVMQAFQQKVTVLEEKHHFRFYHG